MIIVDSIWLDWDFFFFAHIKKWKCFNNNKKKSAGVTMNCHVWFVPSRTGSIGQNSEPVSVFFFSVFFFSVFFVCTGAIDDLPIGKVRSALALLSRAFQIETWYQQVQQYFFFLFIKKASCIYFDIIIHHYCRCNNYLLSVDVFHLILMKISNRNFPLYIIIWQYNNNFDLKLFSWFWLWFILLISN